MFLYDEENDKMVGLETIRGEGAGEDQWHRVSMTRERKGELKSDYRVVGLTAGGEGEGATPDQLLKA